ncbi:hypothetical protein [Xylanimonas oleitrophica]|nr:hypothetical protein [Xylanimonas oleitrophica]
MPVPVPVPVPVDDDGAAPGGVRRRRALLGAAWAAVGRQCL